MMSITDARTDARRRPRYNIMMRWVRRIHMYLGLILIPWILLYGVTGFLFNHPTVLPDFEIRRLDGGDLGEMLLDGVTEPKVIAQMVVNRLEEEQGLPKGHYTVIDPEAVRYGNRTAFFFDRDGDNCELLLDFHHNTVALNARKDLRSGASPLGKIRRLDLPDSIRSTFEGKGHAVLDCLSVSAPAAHYQFGPTVSFDMAAADSSWRLTYNLANRRISAAPSEGWPGLDFLPFLRRLHVTRTFPMDAGLLTVWAILVDGIAGAMVLWAITGILMYWQMKVVRVWGTVVLVCGIVSVVGIGILLHESFRF